MIDMERLLTVWIEECKQKRIPLSKKEIKLKAQCLFNALKENCSEEATNETFLASHGWYLNFKKRLGMHNTPSNKSSIDEDSIIEFPDKLKEIIKKGGYKDEEIFSASKIRLFWKKMPSKTYLARNKNFQSRFKTSQDHLTLLLCGNASGNLKLKPLLVYHAEDKVLSDFAKDTPIYVSNEDSSITKKIFEDWFKNYFCPNLQHYFKNSNMNFRALLLLDYIPDLDNLSLNKNIKILFVSPNKTSILQPLDQGIGSLFRAYYLKQIFSQAIQVTTDETALSLRKFWRNFDIRKVIESISKSWLEMSANSIRTAWKNLLPHHTNGFCDIDSKMHQVLGDIVKIGHSLGFKTLDRADVQECITMHSQGTDDLLLDVDIKKEFEETDCNVNDGQIPEKDLSLQELEEMFTAVATASNIISKSDPDVERSVQARRMLENAVWCYQELYTKKKRLVQSTLDSNP